MTVLDEFGDRWREVDSVLSGALEQPEGERLAYVRERTTGDAELGKIVEELIRAADAATSFLERPIELDSRTWLEASDEFLARSRQRSADECDHVGRVIGVWRIEREMGRGGMSRVFLAERTTGGFEQRAALKLLRSDHDDEIVERFRAERQILSNLSHPNIARLLDGGSTDDGQPYFVMEAVEGQPITEWCDRRRLTVHRRLDLFRDVLAAVQYAHANLVVHRDLKPSNILVTPAGRVKLLDFGIAQLLDPEAGPKGTDGASRLLLTPEYASPEQVAGEAITTATDTYQLGLLLYFLLAGRLPYDVPSQLQLREAVLRSRPPPPSEVVAKADEHVADARRVSPGALARQLHCDLDAIVMKAIRKAPADRHTSVAELEADIADHLGNRPVAAVGGGVRYRVRKYFGRNRWALPTLAAAGIAVAAYVGVQHSHERQLEVERNVARAEASRAEAVKEFMVELYQSADPWSSADPQRGRNITVRAALAEGAERVRSELSDQPEIQGELLTAIAGVLDNLSLPEEALPLREEAVAIHERSDPPDRVTKAALLLELGRTLSGLDRADSAENVLDAAREVTRTLEPPDDTAHASVLVALGNTAVDRGDYATAEELYLRADSILVAHPAALPSQRASIQFGLSKVFSTTNRLADARTAAGRRVGLVTEAFGPEDPNTAAALVFLADVFDMSGHDEAAIAIYGKAAATLERALGEEHDATLATLNNLAITLREVERTEEAEAVLRRVLEIRTRRAGVWDREVANTMQNLASVLSHQKRLKEAIDLLTRAHRIYVTVLPDGHHLSAYPLLTRASIELERREYGAAETTAREALSILVPALSTDHPATAMAGCRLGRALLGQRRYGEAEEPLRRGADVAAESTRLPPAYRVECLDGLAAVLEATGRPAEAQPYRTATSELSSDTTE